MPDLSSVVREAAEREAQKIETVLMHPLPGYPVDTTNQKRKYFIDGFTECASRLPSETEIAKIIFGQRVSDCAGRTAPEIFEVCDEAASEILKRIVARITGGSS